ncbi:hypothetical protein C4552_03090 [Candidatus Parcubacteria bacterium]|nr:MAG: hypothetical protein C4552_03090 [Candidatus Parcubacteria bacterium]
MCWFEFFGIQLLLYAPRKAFYWLRESIRNLLILQHQGGKDVAKQESPFVWCAFFIDFPSPAG